MSTAYTALPKTEAEADAVAVAAAGLSPTPASADYPPSSPIPSPSIPTRLKAYAHRLGTRRYVVSAATALILISLILALRPHSGSDSDYPYAYGSNAAGRGQNVSSPTFGSFYRDPTPALTAAHFWALAETQIKERKLDTCGDMLGRRLVDGQVAKRVEYCGASYTFEGGGDSMAASSASAACFPLPRDGFLSFWPYPSAPCVSRNLKPTGMRTFQATCPLSPAGSVLNAEMKKAGEGFLGSELSEGEGETECKEFEGRTVLVVHRQDQWNPFHVAEDLITTLVTLFIASAAVPALEAEKLQLVFSDDFGMDKNHYTPLYDRMGAWAPRRLTLDPWREGECFSAGSSLLSAIGVGSSNRCASSITWAASHYYRHLFGLLPSPPSRDINVLYLSRATFNAYAEAHGDWSKWRTYRRLENDGELIARLRRGLGEYCADGACVFDDDEQNPAAWTQRSGSGDGDGGRKHVRFAAIDPMVHALETQVHYAGNAQLLVSQHGGGLGLALFMQPAQGAVVELQVEEVDGNFHFEHLAHQTGQRYECVTITRRVDVDGVWGAVRRHVEALSK